VTCYAPGVVNVEVAAICSAVQSHGTDKFIIDHYRLITGRDAQRIEAVRIGHGCGTANRYMRLRNGSVRARVQHDAVHLRSTVPTRFCRRSAACHAEDDRRSDQLAHNGQYIARVVKSE